jgi:ubiquinone biosynthesis protein COQ4
MMLFGRKRGHRSQHIDYFHTLKGVVGMLRDPEHTNSVFDIEDGLRGLDATDKVLAVVRDQPGVAEMIEARWLAPPPNVADLARMPRGTLGWAFAHHLIDHGFDPDYYRKIDVRDDVDYVLMRMRQTHDIWHVVTGIDTSREGELALKAFELAQTRRPLAAVITCGGVMRYLVHDPERLGDVLQAISHGYWLGHHARPMLAQKWEEGWEVPLAEWRERLAIPVPVEFPDADPVLEPDPADDLGEHRPTTGR